ncbi:putative ABC transporter ATP-binding protein YxlF [Rubripirellula obstinata]|uniref:Putative ABC transporter ATP-binding protein YxlF n=1 Tax=Rubripirellula obstinata TaxID=406547 RepID=A0A5B1CL41_9BACT|nr:ABC transporter ATP-binding protein [Rubripirellula obstinata]KAA1260044.1 putative ABC transporter ATP-binding protein YxlF [Rubripirellula obstinata]
MNLSPVVEVCDLRKAYGQGSLFRRRGRVEALRGVSLSAKSGDVFGLLGPNGAGKTTLIKTLLGVVKPSSGTAFLFGQPAGSSAARMRVGYLPETLRVDRHHTARSALKFYGRLSHMDQASINRRSDELLELVGLQGRDRESVRQFSKGMYQRLGLAQALMHDPDLLFLDEPTDGLDPVGRNEVRKVIERLRGLGKTIFLNSHILQEVEMVCTRVAIMDKGMVLASGAIGSGISIDDNGQSDAIIGSAIGSMIDGKHENAAVTFDLLHPSHQDSSNQADETIRKCFDRFENSHAVIQPLTSPIATHRVVVTPSDDQAVSQSDLDRVVDDLRSHSISIVRLDTRVPTLEDTFMRLISSQQG